jgi:polysaccharide export outer membrane protein
VKRLMPCVLLLAAACANPGRAPTRSEYDPAGAVVRPVNEVPLPENKEVEDILNRYEKKMAAGPLILPGDDLRFAVLGQADLTFEARVPQDGVIQYPLIGKVTLAGRMPELVRQEIKIRLERDYLVSADVTVQVKAYAPKRIYVLGAVAHPLDGEVPGGQAVTLLQAIARAGGFTEDAAKHRVIIYRLAEDGGPKRVAIPYSMVGLQEGRGRDPVLFPDDIVLVPAREKIYVLGQVARPGAFQADADNGLTASQAISLAGGYTRVANDSGVRLLRRDNSGARRAYVLNLSRVVNGFPGEDVPLQPGDVLFVPESVF